MWISKLVHLHRSSGAYRGAAYNAELPIRDELLRAAEVAEHRSWLGPCCGITMFVFFFDKAGVSKTYFDWCPAGIDSIGAIWRPKFVS
jgi:hypothetical protein